MPNPFFGTVFDVGSTSQRGESVTNFMKQLGGDPTGTKIDFEPSDIDTKSGDVDLSNQTAVDEYRTNLQNANSMGLALSAKGIDVLNPKTPQEAAAAAKYRSLLSNAQQNLLAMKSSFEARKQFADQRLKDGVINTGGASTGSMTDMDQLVNVQQYDKMLNDSVDSLLTRAKSVNTEVERNEVNRMLKEKAEGLDNAIPVMVQGGVPEELARQKVEVARNRLLNATYDPSKDLDRAMRQADIDADNARADADSAAKRAKLRAQTKKAQGSTEDGDAILDKIVALNRNQGFDFVQGGSPLAPGAAGPSDFMAGAGKMDNVFKGAKIGGKLVENVSFDPTSGKAMIELKGEKDRAEDPIEKIPLDIDAAREILPAKQYDAFISAARKRGMIDSNGNLIIRSDAGINLEFDE